MSRSTAAKIVLTAVCASTTAGAYVFDWDETHIHNPNWPPHAKFHNAQTMSTAAALGLIGLAALWTGRGGLTPQRLRLAALAPSLYWITHLSAIAYPGTASQDPPQTGSPQNRVAAVELAATALALALGSPGRGQFLRRLRP